MKYVLCCTPSPPRLPLAGNLIHAKAQDEGSGPPAQTTGPEGNVKVNRLMAAIEYGRPLAQHWNGTLGVNFQRANCLDDHNQPMTKVMLTVAVAAGPIACMPHHH